MSNKLAERKETVNAKHCCICFKLINVTLFTICISFLLIIAYGIEYYFDSPIQQSHPLNYSIHFIYILIVAIELIACIISCIAVCFHLRRIIKYSLYWTIIHTLVISIIFWLSKLFVSPFNIDFGFYTYITWSAMQILLLYLLWKYKLLLKMVYDWDEEVEEEEDQQPQPHQEEIKTNSPNSNNFARTTRVNSNGTNVNVSINLTQQHKPYVMHPQYPQISSFQRIPNKSMSLPASNIKPNIEDEENKQVVIKIEKQNKAKKKKKKVRDYDKIPTDDLELELSEEFKQNESTDYDSDSLYQETNNQTKQTPTMDRIDTLDLLVAVSDPLPEEQSDDGIDIENDFGTEGSEGVDIDFNNWIIQTLQNCAPINNEWKKYWKNFKKNDITKETLMSLSCDKQRNEWNQLIPKMGPRIQFQQSVDRHLLERKESHFYPSPTGPTPMAN